MTHTDAHLEKLLAEHDTAIREFTARAEAISADQWDVPRAPDKWTPAQETKHLALGYDAFIRDLEGGPKLRLKGTAWQRVLWRLTVLPAIVRQRRIVRSVRAPREVRPPDRPGLRADLVAELRERAGAFDATVRRSATRQPRPRLTHAFFGRLSLRDAVNLCVIHVRHHAAFLPDVARDR